MNKLITILLAGCLAVVHTAPASALAPESSLEDIEKEILVLAQMGRYKAPPEDRYIWEGIDYRPVQNSLLEVPYVGHAMAVCRVVNPEHADGKVGVYGCSGADISNFLLSTDATEAYFIEQTYVSMQELNRILDNEWDNLNMLWDPNGDSWTGGQNLLDDVSWKKKRGYMKADAARMDLIEYKILVELKRMGVEKYREDGKTPNVQIRSGSWGGVEIEFYWDYMGCKTKKYRIRYIRGNITIAQTYLSHLRELLGERDIDVYYQKAGQAAVSRYRRYLGNIAMLLKENGYLVTDDSYFDRFDNPLTKNLRDILENENFDFVEHFTGSMGYWYRLWRLSGAQLMRNRDVDYGFKVIIRQKKRKRKPGSELRMAGIASAV